MSEVIPNIERLGEFGCHMSRNLCSRQVEKDDDDDEKDHISKLEVKFFSFTTVYYIVSP